MGEWPRCNHDEQAYYSVANSFGRAGRANLKSIELGGIVHQYGLALSSVWRLQGGVNNLADRHYFTRRTDEYPGPGILPSLGRSIYVTLRASP